MRSLLWASILALAFLVGPTGVTEAGPPFHCNQVNLHPNSLPNGQVGQPYSTLLWLTPANPALQAYVTNLTGSLPPNLSFSPGPNLNQVTLSGTPTTIGVYPFSVEIGATYVLGTICKVSATYVIVIFP